MEIAMNYIKRMILLSRPGDFYKKSSRKIEAYLSSINGEIDVQRLELPMSASNLTDGSYRIEQLLSGNLGRFVSTARKRMAAHG